MTTFKTVKRTTLRIHHVCKEFMKTKGGKNLTYSKKSGERKMERVNSQNTFIHSFVFFFLF